MKLKKLLPLLIGSLMVISTTASAAIYTFSFSLDGAGMTPPNNVPGTAYGTLTLTDPNTITLDITWTGLTSDFIRVGCGFQETPSSGLGFDFFPPTNMPTSGHWSDTETVAFPASEFVQDIELGHSQVQINTLNYPYDGYGEIAGLINPTPVPEPSGLGLAILAGATGVTFRKLRIGQMRGGRLR